MKITKPFLKIKGELCSPRHHLSLFLVMDGESILKLWDVIIFQSDLESDVADMLNNNPIFKEFDIQWADLKDVQRVNLKKS